jgi:general secretion pathway protein G
LIELLIVIVIIGILIALLLPVIAGAVKKANEAKVSADINTIANALVNFKEKYGEYPPSRVVLSEAGVYSLSGGSIPIASDFASALTAMAVTNGPASTTSLSASKIGNPDISFGELAQRSLRALRKFFPRAALGPADQDGDGTNDYWPDYNGNNVQDPGFLYLEGDECLVFFLGGIPNPSVDTAGRIVYGTSGFAKDPRYPFKNAGVVASAMSTSNRTSPLYEFNAGRMVDFDGDGIPSYLDANASNGVGVPYAYFATYGGTGYDPNDTNFGDDGNFGIGNTYRIGLPAISASGTTNTVFSPTPNPYTSSLPTPGSANQPAAYINPNSFQIISSGGDGLFGPGGQFSSSGGDRLPPSNLRTAEYDNVTNFTNGRMN